MWFCTIPPLTVLVLFPLHSHIQFSSTFNFSRFWNALICSSFIVLSNRENPFVSSAFLKSINHQQFSSQLIISSDFFATWGLWRWFYQLFIQSNSALTLNSCPDFPGAAWPPGHRSLVVSLLLRAHPSGLKSQRLYSTGVALNCKSISLRPRKNSFIHHDYASFCPFPMRYRLVPQ